MKEIIEEIAKENNVSPEEVERDMQEAIAKSPEMDTLRNKLGREPSLEEFILHCAAKVN